MTPSQPPIRTRHEPAPTVPPTGIPADAYPLGVAPIAAGVEHDEPLPRPRVRSRPRLLAAAAVTGAMALLPLAGPTALARDRDRHAMRVASAELFLRSKAAEIPAAPAGPPASDAGGTSATGSAEEPAGRSRPLPGPDAAPADATGTDVPSGDRPERQDAAPAAADDGAPDAEAAEAASTDETAAKAGNRPAEQPPAPKEPTPVASVSGIRLVVPSMATAVVGFHEAAIPGSLEMASVAPLEAKHNPRPMPEIAKTQPEQVAPVMVLPTRARPAPPSTAMDVAVPAGEEILSLVDGTVTAVLPYTLYGEHPDFRVEIQPEGRPDLRVVMIHVSDVSVEAGDEVRKGETLVAGTATQFPFESQIDRFTEDLAGQATPHVHVEVKQVG